MTAVIYARYSTDSQREESIEGQIRECTAYAEKNGFTVVKHYIDRAVSAKTDNRPQFQQMIKDSERGIFDVIIVWKLDRFARNRYDSARYKTQLKRNGVKLVSATEVISAGPEGIILESVLEGYAEYYSADLSEKVVRGMTENALKGIYNGGTIPFGYMIDETRHYQPDPLLAPYVERGLTQGMFVGSVSDNFTERIEQKIFHAEIVVDTDKVKREERISSSMTPSLSEVVGTFSLITTSMPSSFSTSSPSCTKFRLKP